MKTFSSFQMLDALFNGIIVQLNLRDVMWNVKSGKIVKLWNGMVIMRYAVACALLCEFRMVNHVRIMCTCVNHVCENEFGSGDIVPYFFVFFFWFWCRHTIVERYVVSDRHIYCLNVKPKKVEGKRCTGKFAMLRPTVICLVLNVFSNVQT